MKKTLLALIIILAVSGCGKVADESKKPAKTIKRLTNDISEAKDNNTVVSENGQKVHFLYKLQNSPNLTKEELLKYSAVQILVFFMYEDVLDSGGRKSKQVIKEKEDILKHIINEHGTEIEENEYFSKDYNIGATASYCLADYYIKNKRFDEAKKVFNDMLTKYKGTKASRMVMGSSTVEGDTEILVYLELMDMYSKTLKDYQKAIEYGHLVIKRFHSEKLRYWEGWGFAAESARYRIMYIMENIMEANPGECIQQCRTIINESKNDACIINSYFEIARQYCYLEKYEDAIKELNIVKNNYKNIYKVNFDGTKSEVSWYLDACSREVEIYQKLKIYNNNKARAK